MSLWRTTSSNHRWHGRWYDPSSRFIDLLDFCLVMRMVRSGFFCGFWIVIQNYLPHVFGSWRQYSRRTFEFEVSDRFWSVCKCKTANANNAATRFPSVILHRAVFHSSIILGCWPATFVRYAVKTTSAVLTDTPAGCPPVAVRNCWWPSLRCRWCSAMELPVYHRTLSRTTHCHSSVVNWKHFCSNSLTLLCFWRD